MHSSNVLYFSLWSAVDMSDVSSNICLCQEKFTKAEMIIHLFEMRNFQNHQHSKVGFVDISRKGI